MNLTQAVTSVLTKYVTFSGRASRSEFWFWVLANTILSFVLMALEAFILNTKPGTYGPLTGIYSLAVLLPNIALSVRRLHDVNRRGWWLFIALVPLVGPILLLVWYCMRGTDGDNRFGPDPLARY